MIETQVDIPNWHIGRKGRQQSKVILTRFHKLLFFTKYCVAWSLKMEQHLKLLS